MRYNQIQSTPPRKKNLQHHKHHKIKTRGDFRSTKHSHIMFGNYAQMTTRSESSLSPSTPASHKPRDPECPANIAATSQLFYVKAAATPQKQ